MKLCSCCNKQCIQKTNWNHAQCLKLSACKHSRHRSNYLLLYFSVMEILQKKKRNVWHGCIFGLHLFLRLLEKLIRSSSSPREGWGEDFLWLFTSQWQRFILSFPSSDHIQSFIPCQLVHPSIFAKFSWTWTADKVELPVFECRKKKERLKDYRGVWKSCNLCRAWKTRV